MNRDDPNVVKALADTIVAVVTTPEMVERLTITGVCAALEWAKAGLLVESLSADVERRTAPAPKQEDAK